MKRTIKIINTICNILIIAYALIAIGNLWQIEKPFKTLAEGAGAGCGLGVLIMLYLERQKAKENKLKIRFYEEKANFAVKNLYWCYEQLDKKNKKIKDLKRKKISLRSHIRQKRV